MVSPGDVEATTKPKRHGAIRGMIRLRSIVLAALVLAVVALTLVAAARMPVSGDVAVLDTLDLNAGTPTPGVESQVERDENGFLVDGRASATASIPLRSFGELEGEDRALLAITAYGGPELDTDLEVITAAGARRTLATPTGALSAEQFDVTDDARSGILTLYVRARNEDDQPALFLDQVIQMTAPESMQSSASRWLVAAWLAVLVATVLHLRRRLAHHWPLPIVVGLAGYLFWGPVVDQSFDQLGGQAAALWEAATAATWVSLDTGLVSGSWELLSSLTVQMFHALTPLTGDGDAGARAASSLVGVAALIGIYAAGNRVAGRLGAVTAASLALIADPFRLAAASGEATTTLIFAAALLLTAIHVCLARTSRDEIIVLAAGGALAVLAEPTWLPGVLATMVVLTLAYGPRGQRLRVISVGLLALAVLLLPHLVSVANQNEGNLNAEVTQRATAARNIEFLGEGHGAPDSEAQLAGDPLAGPDVGLAEYLLWDHSPVTFAGGALSGLYENLSAASERHEARLLGLLGFVVGVLGAIYLLLIPRLRMLLLLPVLVGLPTLFFASRDVLDPFVAGAALWPAFLVGGGVLAYVAYNALVRKWHVDQAVSAVVAPPWSRTFKRAVPPRTARRNGEQEAG